MILETWRTRPLQLNSHTNVTHTYLFSLVHWNFVPFHYLYLRIVFDCFRARNNSSHDEEWRSRIENWHDHDGWSSLLREVWVRKYFFNALWRTIKCAAIYFIRMRFDGSNLYVWNTLVMFSVFSGGQGRRKVGGLGECALAKPELFSHPQFTPQKTIWIGRVLFGFGLLL